MFKKFLFFIFIILFIIFIFSKTLYPIHHTELEIQILNKKQKCSPEVLLKVKRFGVENVVTSAVRSDPFFVNMTFAKLSDELKLEHVCVNNSNAVWTLTLYAKQTFFTIPKVELVNETI